jgi:hypothetical protein
MSRLSHIVAVAFLGWGLVAQVQPVQASLFLVDPRANYLHLASGDVAPSSTPIFLGALPFAVSAGDFLRLERIGDFDFGPGDDVGINMIAVFSSSSTILDASALHRIPGAIDVSVDIVTGPNMLDGSLNDIAEDFAIFSVSNPVTSVIVQIPVGAAYLFVSTKDSHYYDNSDPDGDYGVSITKYTSINPEPSSLAVFGLIGMTVVLLRRVGKLPSSVSRCSAP